MTLHLLEHEHYHILDRIRSWLTLDLQPQHTYSLAGGESGAEVTRLSVKWQGTTGALVRERPEIVATVGSAVVKIDTLPALQRAQQAYAAIHPGYQHYVARILSGPDPFEDGEMGYLLFEDLTEYHTLQDTLRKGDGYYLSIVVEQLVAFLGRFYAMPIATQKKQQLNTDFMQRCYFSQIERSLQKLQRYEPYLLNFTKHSENIRNHCSAVGRRLAEDATFPQTVMHGDLHLRNIMLHEARPETGDIDFRLIDLDRFTCSCGDVAYDFGELLTDIEIRTLDGELPYQALDFQQRLYQAFSKGAGRRQDRTFHLRVALAQTRALLKLTELHVEQVIGQLGLSGQSTQSKQSSVFIQTHLARAYEYLVEALG